MNTDKSQLMGREYIIEDLYIYIIIYIYIPMLNIYIYSHYIYPIKSQVLPLQSSNLPAVAGHTMSGTKFIFRLGNGSHTPLLKACRAS